MSKIKNWFIDAKAEFKKVVWPSFSKVKQNTIIVLVFVILIAVFIAALDWIFAWGIGALIK
ncbi:MAG: preprotein translocase subunit SecE [Clostridia bacterium]|nr:preprotein translocase subunit SecE [Clostridia bacterium]